MHPAARVGAGLMGEASARRRERRTGTLRLGTRFVTLGALSASLAVAAGAFGAHALQQRLPPDRMDTFEVGARYHMYHALGLLAAAWVAERWPHPAARLAGWLF